MRVHCGYQRISTGEAFITVEAAKLTMREGVGDVGRVAPWWGLFGTFMVYRSLTMVTIVSNFIVISNPSAKWQVNRDWGTRS